MNDQPETILLAVTGMSPAILTETIWALAHEPEPIIPSRIMVVTTLPGHDQLRQLFIPNPGWGGISPWDALREVLVRRGHDLTGRLRFGMTGDDVRILTACDPVTGQSREMDDLRTPADNEAAADFLLEQVRSIVENPDTRLVASLAGGRKTMGALLYACLTLAGRENDRLTHVLVSEPFETLRGFWFPSQPGGELSDREGARHRPDLAQVELADVPFVPLRNLFRKELGQPAGSFRRLLDLCRTSVRVSTGENLRLEISRSRPTVWVNKRPLNLSASEHLVMLFLAEHAKGGQTVFTAYKDMVAPLGRFREECHRQANERDFGDWRHGLQTGDSLEAETLSKVLSRIRDKAQRAGGDLPFLADVLPAKGRYALDVPGSMIHIKP